MSFPRPCASRSDGVPEWEPGASFSGAESVLEPLCGSLQCAWLVFHFFLFYDLPRELWHLFIYLGKLYFSRSAMSDSLRPHGLQHARLPCPSPTPGACLNSCLSTRWWHPTISSSVVPVSSRLQSFPASGSFPVSRFFTSGGQSIGVSASASVLPMSINGWFPLGWTGWIS